MNLNSILSKYDKCRQLECDGMTRVIHTVLSRSNYSHTVKLGTVRLGNNSFFPHYWIELPDGSIVDYRARMWLGKHAPHGIFKKSNAVYEGEPIEMGILSDQLFDILTS